MKDNFIDCLYNEFASKDRDQLIKEVARRKCKMQGPDNTNTSMQFFMLIFIVMFYQIYKGLKNFMLIKTKYTLIICETLLKGKFG